MGMYDRQIIDRDIPEPEFKQVKIICDNCKGTGNVWNHILNQEGVDECSSWSGYGYFLFP